MLHNSGLGRSSPFPRTDLSYGPRKRYAERALSVQHGDTNLQFGDLSIEVSGSEGLAVQLDAVHL